MGSSFTSFSSKISFSLQGNNDQRIAIVALSGIEYTGNAADIAQWQFIVAVFGATGC